jgi:hypothetical protein
VHAGRSLCRVFSSMTIRGVDRDRFEVVLKERLSPTTPIRTPEVPKGREKILEDVCPFICPAWQARFYSW